MKQRKLLISIKSKPLFNQFLFHIESNSRQAIHPHFIISDKSFRKKKTTNQPAVLQISKFMFQLRLLPSKRNAKRAKANVMVGVEKQKKIIIIIITKHIQGTKRGRKASLLGDYIH